MPVSSIKTSRAGVKQALLADPLAACPLHVLAMLFRGPQVFFLRVMLRRSRKRHSALRLVRIRRLPNAAVVPLAVVERQRRGRNQCTNCTSDDRRRSYREHNLRIRKSPSPERRDSGIRSCAVGPTLRANCPQCSGRRHTRLASMRGRTLLGMVRRLCPKKRSLGMYTRTSRPWCGRSSI
jgi:hypothetical protein